MIGRRRAAIGFATLAFVVLLWFPVTTWTGIVSAGRFPSPADFWFSLVQITTRGYAGAELFAHALHSLLLVIIGFLVAVNDRSASRPVDGMEPARRGCGQSRLPHHPADPAAGLDSAGDPMA